MVHLKISRFSDWCFEKSRLPVSDSHESAIRKYLDKIFICGIIHFNVSSALDTVTFVFDDKKKLLKRNAELLNGNTECDTLQIIPLVEAIHTNVVRLYISGFIGLEVKPL